MGPVVDRGGEEFLTHSVTGAAGHGTRGDDIELRAESRELRV